MIEDFNPYIIELLKTEPWRAGEGVGFDPCPGDLTWDGTEPCLWHCRSCGRIGTAMYTWHLPLLHTHRLVGAVVGLLRAVSREVAAIAPP